MTDRNGNGIGDEYEDKDEDERDVDRDSERQAMSSGYEEYPGLTATREELCELARYWLTQMYEIDVFYAFNGVASGCDNRDYLYAEQRVQEIRQAIGREAVQGVNEKVAERYRRQLGERRWRILTSGTREEKDELRRELHAEI
jgi:hypothetical protein